MTAPGTIVTFYSYKGGVGRTMALANISALLSVWGYRVLCIDWDLEAPGLPLYFRDWSPKAQQVGLVDYFTSVAKHQHVDWRDYVYEAVLPGAARRTGIISAGVQDGTYLERMQALSWTDLYEVHNLGSLIETLRKEWKSEFDFVFVDSRTGITDIGGICSIQIPDVLCILFTANEQSVGGSVDIVDRVQRARSGLPFDRSNLQVIPVLSRLESRVEYDRSQRWLERVSTAFGPVFRNWAHRNVSPEQLLTYLRIPNIPFWGFGEDLAVVLRGTRDPEDIGFAYENIAALIANGLTGSEVLVENRDAFVASARLAPAKIEGLESTHTRNSGDLAVYLSYSHRDKEFARDLDAHLAPLKRSGLIRVWHDWMIGPGESWSREIDLQIEEAQLILLLISPDYLASDYSYGIEMQRSLERQYAGVATVVPIILRPCDWSISPIGTLQALPDSGRPVSLWADRDAAFVNIVQGIRNIIQTRLTPKREYRPLLRVAYFVPMVRTSDRTWAGTLPSEVDLEGARLILSVKPTSLAPESVHRIPQLIKIASGEHLETIVSRALPGILLRHLSQAPPEIRSEIDATYFELATQNALWQAIRETRTIALYAPHEVSDAVYELTVIYPK